MAIENPDFYLTAAGEMIGDLASVRACRVACRVADPFTQVMLIEVDPPVIGQNYGLGDNDINHLIVAPHFSDSTLFPMISNPCHVYVYRLLDNAVLSTKTVTKDQIEMVAWGELFRTFREAETYFVKRNAPE